MKPQLAAHRRHAEGVAVAADPRHHALHHFHSENGNYGIVTDVLDRVLGTEYEVGTGMGPSPTVRNLGYTSEEAKKYPWVAQLDQAQPRN